MGQQECNHEAGLAASATRRQRGEPCHAPSPAGTWRLATASGSGRRQARHPRAEGIDEVDEVAVLPVHLAQAGLEGAVSANCVNGVALPPVRPAHGSGAAAFPVLRRSWCALGQGEVVSSGVSTTTA
jgi:hypothetical protein